MSLPYDYYPLVLNTIDLISQGYLRTHACDQLGLRIATFEHYVKNDAQLQELLHEAETRGYDALADALLRIDNHALYGQSDPKMAKVISDNIKFLLSKRRPKEYGERITITHNITADKAITDALTAGKHRALAAQQHGTIIDVTPVVEQTDEEIMAEILGGAAPAHN